MGTVYQGILRCRNRTWTCQLRKAGGTLVSDDHDVSLNTNLQWGEDSDSGFLDRFIMPASLQISFTDPGSVIWDDIRTSGPNTFTLRLTDSTFTYEIDLFCRLADSYTPLKSDVATPITSLIASCGLTRTQNQDATATTIKTVHQTFKALLVDQILAQDIQYLFSTRNSRSGSSGALAHMIRLDDIVYAYKGLGDNPDELDTAGNQLTDLCETFQCMLFNDLFYGRRWVVAQPWLLGLDITEASRLAQLYDRSLDAIAANAVSGILKTIVATDDTQRGLFDPDYAVRIVNGSKRDDITNIFINQGSLDEGWSGSGNAFWVSSNPNTFHETTEGGYIDDGGEDILQDTVLVERGKWVRIGITLEYAMEYTVAGSGNHQFGMKLIADPLDPTGTTYYSTDGGVTEIWDTPDNTINDSAQTPDANGTAPASLTWHTFTGQTLADYMNEDARLRFQILGDTGNDYYLHLRNVTFFLEDQAASAVTDTPPWPSHGASPAVGGSVTEGETIEYQRQWSPVTLERTAPNEYPQVQIDVTGSGSWGLPALWLDSSSVGQADSYADINELIIRQRLKRGEGGRLIRGTYRGILTPASVLQALGGRYLPIYLSVNLHTEMTEFLVYEELLSYSA